MVSVDYQDVSAVVAFSIVIGGGAYVAFNVEPFIDQMFALYGLWFVCMAVLYVGYVCDMRALRKDRERREERVQTFLENRDD